MVTRATREAVLAAIADIAARELDRAGPIRVEQRIGADIGLDSLEATILAVALEDRFSVRLHEADAATVATVGDLVALVVRRAGGEA
jgi:acyl carrier protein